MTYDRLSDLTFPPTRALPNPLHFNLGAPVVSPSQWHVRRREIHALMVPLAYGEMPPVPVALRCVVLHTAVVQNLRGARLLSCRVTINGEHAFLIRIFVPAAAGLFPVVLSGDGCWHYASDEVIETVLDSGYVFAQFNRVELAPDVAHKDGADFTSCGGTEMIPHKCPALMAWAWGYHRAVDALVQLDFVDQERIAIVGHSRGGKAALLAGATDERIALTSANGSGAGGAGCFRVQGPRSETLADVVGAFPHWFNPHLAQFAGREDDLPFDQHFLKALIAPRALLTTEALDDLWANPVGTWVSHLAAREVYKFLGAEDRIAIAYREGGHDHCMADWQTLLDFCETVFHGKPLADVLQVNPFPDLQARFNWQKND